MKSTFNILFFIKKNEAKQNGYCTIMVRITIDGEYLQFSTKQEILPYLWNQKNGSASGRTIAARQVNDHLTTIRLDLHNHYRKLSDKYGKVFPLMVKNAYLTPEDYYMLGYQFEEQLKHLKSRIGKNLTKETYYRYELTWRRLQNFIKEKYNSSDIPLEKINLRFLEKFYLFLREKHDCANDTAQKFMQKLEAVLIYAEKMQVIPSNPFLFYTYQFDKKKPVYLTKQEIDRIWKKQFKTPRLTLVKDLFIFSCYTGLSFAEICNLRKDNIQKMNDGSSWIFIKRKKTDVMSYIPLLPIPIQLIGKCQNAKNEDLVFNTYTNQKTNEYLKEIAEVCGIRKNLIFHLARHSFGTLALSYGVSIESISGMLGHTNITTTQIYAQITKQKIGEEMKGFKRGLVNADEFSKQMKKGYDIYLQLLDTARRMKEDKYSIEQIIYYTGLSREEIVAS